MLQIAFSKPAEKYFKKLKNEQLKKKYEDAIIEIRNDPDCGERKAGDLSGIYGYDVYYSGVNYEVAYFLTENNDGEVVVVIMAGTRENFWNLLKNYMK